MSDLVAAPSGSNSISAADWPGSAVVFLLLLLPPALPYLLNASSFATGVVIVCLFALALRFSGLVAVRNTTRLSNETVFAIAAPILIASHLFITSFAQPIELTRGLQSLAILTLVLFAAPMMSRLIFEIDGDKFEQRMKIVRWTFVVVAIASLAGLQPPTLSEGAKPTFPFTEPSFFAFTFVPILVYTCVVSKLGARIAWLVAIVTLGLLVKNLTIITACGLAAAACLPVRVGIPAALLVGYIATQIDLSYFQERLDISVDSDNISALVYAQGWQLLEEALRMTNGWGRGFQQLGFGYTNVPASYRLFYLLKRDANLLDGGFLLAKMGSEFGILGLIFVTFVTVQAGRCLIVLRQIATRGMAADKAAVLALASCYSIVLEIFVRGAGYFTGTVMLVTMSTLFLWRRRFEWRQQDARLLNG